MVPNTPRNNTTSDQRFVDTFRQSSPYIRAHSGKTFVITFGGEIIASNAFRHIIHDIALLNTLGIRLILVYGARPQIDERLALRGLTSRFHQQMRITDSVAIESVKDAVGYLRCQIEAMLSTGLPNSPMQGASIRVVGGNFVTAKPVGIHDGIDFHHTGAVRRIDSAAINRLLDDDCVVLMSPVGYSPTGEIFNMPAEDLATETAIALKADKLIYFDSSEGVVDEQGHLVAQLSAQQAAQLHETTSRYNPIIDASIMACRRGIERVHIISSQSDGTLLRELFTRDGCGTLIYADHYDIIRQANIDDVGGILNLIRPLEQSGVLVRRSREYLETEIEQFFVIERDGMVIGCAALYLYDDEAMAELACVVIHPQYRGSERGELLLAKIEERARSIGMQQVFVLTTQTAHWFQEQGFIAANSTQLPSQKQQLYNYQRNSKIFVKQL